MKVWQINVMGRFFATTEADSYFEACEYFRQWLIDGHFSGVTYIIEEVEGDKPSRQREDIL